MKRTVIIHSGGMDSTVLLAHLLAEGREAHALSVDYGQRHRRELVAAAEICAHYRVPHRVADLRGVTSLFGANALTDAQVAVPEGHYEEASMKATVVPNRNMLAHRDRRRLGDVALRLRPSPMALTAAIMRSTPTAGRPSPTPWTRPSASPIGMRSPWSGPSWDMDKAAIVRRGAELGVPFALTWSCYVGGDRHCGRCGTCVERREAFQRAGVTDPTPYAA